MCEIINIKEYALKFHFEDPIFNPNTVGWMVIQSKKVYGKDVQL